ncbi:MAG: ABC transporter ATP-binding protein [Myxococcota bacterium]
MIVAEHISKHYGARLALDDVSFRIAKGEVIGFLGLNGAGKTTMLKVLSGLLLPSRGRVIVDGVDGARDARGLRRRIGFLPDRPPLYLDFTVRQMLRYAGGLHGLEGRFLEQRVDEVLALAGLTHVQDDLIEWLSHGYRQRVGIAQTIVHAPALVILDEPISGLDPEQIVSMRALIRGLAEHHTVLLSSHILGEISQTCDRLLVLQAGRLVAEGTEEQLMHGVTPQGLELTVRGTEENARGALGAVGSISAVELVAKEGEFVRLRLDAASPRAAEEAVAALVAAGLGVRRVVERGGGLEAVFLSLTRGASKEAA